MQFLRGCLFVISIILITPTLNAQGIVQIKGQVVDSKSKKPLEYASVGLLNRHQGTITNQYGYFSFYIPDSLKYDTIQINYLGYESYSVSVTALSDKKNKIKLRAISTEISEVIIRPLTPLEIIRRVKENYPTNYPQTPFISKGFYLQEIVENDIFIDFIEAYVDIYNPPFDDTSSCQARLIQGRTKDDMGDIQFMKRFSEKKYAKRVKKADRKGDTIDTIASPGIQVLFGGPESIASDDNIRQLNNFFDKKTMKKFNYTFENNTHFAGRELYVIRCKSKKPIDHLNIDAHLYIDKESYAIATFKAEMTIDIPTLVKPLLRMYRIKVSDIAMNQDIEYKLINGTWYPNKTISYGYMDAQKKYKGKYKEHSIVTIKKAFITTNIQDNNITTFTDEEQLTDAPLHEQLGDYNPEFWINRNKIDYRVSDE